MCSRRNGIKEMEEWEKEEVYLKKILMKERNSMIEVMEILLHSNEGN